MAGRLYRCSGSRFPVDFGAASRAGYEIESSYRNGSGYAY